MVLDSRITRLEGSNQPVLLNSRGCLRAMPSEEVRRAEAYRGNDFREKGTHYFVIIGNGIKRLLTLSESESKFSGRMTLRVALICRFLG